jgi:hypothetical protein
VAVDDLVVVADAEHVEPGRGQQAHEQHVGRRQVLELVDEEVAVTGLLRPPEGAVAEQQLDREQHLLVEVDHPAPAQLVAVGGERLGEAGHVAPGLLDLGGVAQAEADLAQGVDVGRQRVGVEPPGHLGDQRLEQPADLALLDHVGPPAEAGRHQVVAEGVEREDAGADTARARRHLVAGLAVVGDGDDARRLVAPVDDQMAQAGGEHAGLARARRGDDAGGAGAVLDRRQLVGRQVDGGRRAGGLGGLLRRHPGEPPVIVVVGRRHGIRRRRLGLGRGDRRRVLGGAAALGHGGEHALLDRLGVDEGGADVARRQVAPGAAVDPRRRAVGQQDVARAVGGGRRPQALGLAAPPPHGGAGAGVVRVGPHEEVEPVERQVEPGVEQPGGRRLVVDRVAEAGRVDRQGDDHRPAGRPGLVQGGDHRLGRGQHRLVDGDHRGVGPRRRDGVARGDHHTPSQHGRPRNAHGGPG